MPMINAQISTKLLPEQKQTLVKEFGKAITVMNKSESHLMINIEDEQNLFFAGNILEKGAYIEIKVLGDVNPVLSEKMTEQVCKILEKNLGINPASVYVSYFGTHNWGHNGSNF